MHRLALRVTELVQLFHFLDPTPFLHRNLDRSAEAYIENRAREFPPDSRLQITIHLEHAPATGNPTVLMTQAVHNHFDYRASLMRGELRQLLRQGRTSLCIGLAFVAVCLLIADAITQAGDGDVHTSARECLTIVGRVAMWRPVEIFLYDWWPLVRRIRIYKNLRYARVRVVPAHDGP